MCVVVRVVHRNCGMDSNAFMLGQRRNGTQNKNSIEHHYPDIEQKTHTRRIAHELTRYGLSKQNSAREKTTVQLALIATNCRFKKKIDTWTIMWVQLGNKTEANRGMGVRARKKTNRNGAVIKLQRYL